MTLVSSESISRSDSYAKLKTQGQVECNPNYAKIHVLCLQVRHLHDQSRSDLQVSVLNFWAKSCFIYLRHAYIYIQKCHLCMNLGHIAGEFAKGGAIYIQINILVMQTISLAGLDLCLLSLWPFQICVNSMLQNLNRFTANYIDHKK